MKVRFKKGHTPWNKGLKGWTKKVGAGFQVGNKLWDNPSVKRTQFKKGSSGFRGRHSKESIEKMRKSHKGMNASEQSVFWKGEDAKYGAIHMWVKKHKGAPSLCKHCGTATAKKFHWANIDHKYKRRLKDYIRLCSQCHRDYDIAFLRYKQPVSPADKYY